ncbi:thiol-disulfide oxidoreductase DCC family protein [Allonocardiopsis opalescens]|uniref:Putative DCC family thiol-disulfide oxidoreductase YuxK n=1 Tax=Allonocardiopsis opalescens TaxID=1144618 RepID=A0A2T0PWZ8_9ACTN|nr:DUF393 domain-containing protein [Allonocardiopsis opalescens]PRX96069.1 putative DCC family thiol-disulfide oxidoreductase YuxK [Allonocardiopsis opalescens]
MAARTRPVLVYDGDCAICTRCVAFAERYVKADADIVAWQFADLAALGTTAERAEYEVLWVRKDGRVEGGSDAVGAVLLSSARPYWWPLGSLLRAAPLRPLMQRLYQLVAVNRHRLPGGTAACAMPAHLRPGAGGAS